MDNLRRCTNPVSGRAAFVTGAASGIGAASAIALASLGYRVTVADIDEVGARATVGEIIAAGGTADHVSCDVTDEDAVAEAVTSCEDLTVAVNSAGIPGRPIRPVGELSADDFDRVVAINLRGAFLSMKHELRAMADAGGAIVNVSSAAGLVGAPGVAAYAASQHGIVGLTKTAALDYSNVPVRVNAVCCGALDGPMVQDGRSAARVETVRSAHPLGRLGRVNEIVAAVTWLCSDGAAFVTGAAVPVDGGFVAR